MESHQLILGAFTESNDVMMIFWGVAGLVGLVAVVCGFVFSLRKEAMKNDQAKLSHEERMRAIELGQPLPDAEIARANADASRARAAGAVGTLVPIAAIGAGAAVSWIIVREPFQGNWVGLHPHGHLLIIIWGAVVIVSLFALIGSLHTMRRITSAGKARELREDPRARGEPQPVGFKDRITPA